MEKLAIEGGEPIRTTKKTPFKIAPVIEEDDIESVMEVLRSGILTGSEGEKVRQFEEEFAEYYDVKHAVAVNSGTSSLHMAVEVAGIGPGDEVIVPAITFIASGTAVLQNNAIPVFCDIDPKTYNIDPEDAARKISKRTKAIMPVHLFGEPCDMDPIMELSEAHKLIVIEDCAHAHGAEYKGRKVGTIGDMGCFSLWQLKNLSTGEGGMFITDDDKLAEGATAFRRFYHIPPSGFYGSTTFSGIGWNYKMSGLQAAIGLSQLRKFPRFNEARRRNGEYLHENLKTIKGFTPQHVIPGVKHVWYQFAGVVDERVVGVSRDRIAAAISAELGGIPHPGWMSIIWTWPGFPMYRYPVFAEQRGHGGTKCPFVCTTYGHDANYKGISCPNADKFAESSLSVGITQAMSLTDMEGVVKAFEKVFLTYAERAR